MKEYETVIIAEKPSQAKAYAQAFPGSQFKGDHTIIKPNQYLKDGAIIIACVGHLLEIPKPGELDPKWNSFSMDTLPINPPKIVYQVKANTKNVFDVFEKHLKNAKTLIVGTDLDREGEAIAWSLIEFLNIDVQSKVMKRIRPKSLEQQSILDAFKNMTEAHLYYRQYIEARTRMFSDYLIGMNASTLYSQLIKQKIREEKGIHESYSFSIGRVQTPTLALLYEREKAIQNFKATPFYEAQLKVKHPHGEFIAKADGRYEQREQLIQLLSENTLTVGQTKTTNITNVHKTVEHVKPPKLFTLSNLQSRLNKKYKFSPNKSMKIIQSLYENKLITYPRTAIPYITEEEFNYLKDHFSNYTAYLNLDLEIHHSEPNVKYVNKAKVEEHFAIVPTRNTPKKDELSEDEKKVYGEVVKNTIAMFLEDYTYEKTVVEINEGNILFKASGKVEKQLGWKILLNDKNEDPEEETPFEEKDEVKLPVVQTNDLIQITPNLHEGKTTIPKRYSEGELLTVMKNAAKNLTDEELEMLEEEEPSEFELGTEATRTPIIETLKDREYIVIKKNKVYVTSKGAVLCKILEGTLLASPVMTAKWEAFLKMIGRGEQEEQTFIDNIFKFIDKMISEAPSQIRSEVIETFLSEKNDEEAIALCPLCKKANTVDKGRFYGCSNKECNQTFSKTLINKEISAKQLERILTKGSSTLIKGFKGKSGKQFDAYVALELKENKYAFTFKFN